MFEKANLIYNKNAKCDPVFRFTFKAKPGSSAKLTVSALGVFTVYLNGSKAGREVMAPGWQNYEKRIAAIDYELTGLMQENVITIFASRGWFSGKINTGYNTDTHEHPIAIIAEMDYISEDGSAAHAVTDEGWQVSDSAIVESDIYDGIIYDATHREAWGGVSIYEYDKSKFSYVGGVPVIESETVYPSKVITTPKGERVIDFGINLVGYPVIKLSAKSGERVSFSFAEILDKDGNFYNENYRLAKCRYVYITKDGEQSFKPIGTFYGFRYLRIDELPESCEGFEVCAKIIHSDIKRTGYISTSNALLNRLYDNIIRGQLGNYVDIPTDCPQRNERLGWTGDAQVFVKAAAYNFNVLEFFRKWLSDVVLSQSASGAIPQVVPVPDTLSKWRDSTPRAAWSDAITICPYEIYMAYGDISILSLTFDAMVRHVDAIGERTKQKYLWVCDDPQYGDWLGLDAKPGSYRGASSEAVISTAYYARSAEILVKAGELLGRDVSCYRELYKNIKAAFIENYEPHLKTQTECAIALHFGLVRDTEEITRRLVEKIHSANDKLETGFVGTPYILHALTANGESELAYTLMLNEDYPSWLYPVTMGATTIWEHWDGIRPDGVLWSKDMNSYNHYAYGACADWLFSVAGGIKTHPDYPGYKKAIISPVPDPRLNTFRAELETEHGRISSTWYYEGDTAHYKITTPVDTTVIIEGRSYELSAGTYTF